VKVWTATLAGLTALGLAASLVASPALAANAGKLVACAPGAIKAHKIVATPHGRFLIEATESNEFDWNVCVVSPTFRTHRQNGVDLVRFGNGKYFRTDSLGHVFYNLNPGQISGVGVLVFRGTTARQLGIYAGGKVLVRAHAPLAIRVAHNDCNPDCATGHITYRTLTWHPATQNYR
jgi:hypothetical protein